MDKQIQRVEEFHKNFNQLVSKNPTLIPKDRSDNRYILISEEVKEYKKSVDQADIKNIAKELADILYTTYGAIIEHGLQDKMSEIFSEVHRSNMSKDYHQYKMIKGNNYREPDINL